MKVKTSIALSGDLVEAVDQRTGHKNRSEFIEKALRAFISQILRNEQNSMDIQIINKRAAHLNKEAEDVLAYQRKL